MSKNTSKPKGKQKGNSQHIKHAVIKGRSRSTREDKTGNFCTPHQNTLKDEIYPDISSQVQTKSSESNKYRPRKIVTDVDRYAEVSNDVLLEPRGQDFHYLLEISSATDSHFKMKEEKEWEEDDSLATCESLRIDCNALKAALDTIPLHKRLNLPLDVFASKDIQHFENTAEEKNLVFRQTQSYIQSLNLNSSLLLPAAKNNQQLETNTTAEKKVAGKSFAADLEDDLDRLLSLANSGIVQTSSRGKISGRSTSFEDLLDLALED